MKISLVLRAALGLALLATTASAAQWWDIWPIRKELPEEICGEYQMLEEILTEGGQEKVVEVSGVYFTIEPNRVLQFDNEIVDREIMEITNILRTKKEGKFAYLVVFNNSSLVWLFVESDTPSQLAVIQNDENDSTLKRFFVLKRLDALPAEDEESTSSE